MGVDQWTRMPDEETIKKTAEAIRSRGITVIIVENKDEALSKVKELIPKGAEVMNGSSTTLREIGFMDYLKSGKHGWKNLHLEVLNEKDPKKQSILRRKSVTAEYFLGSVNAISKNGELAACDQSGSRVGAYTFSAGHVILVSGVQKITDNLEQALRRIREYVYPLEDTRAKEAYGRGSVIGKCIILEQEVIPNRTTLILVKEKLGF